MIKAEGCDVTVSGNGFETEFEFTNILRAFYKMRSDAIGETLAKRDMYQDLKIACGDAKAPFEGMSTEEKILAIIVAQSACLNLMRKDERVCCPDHRDPEPAEKPKPDKLDLTKEQKDALLDLVREVFEEDEK